jgi:hypothetical protein
MDTNTRVHQLIDHFTQGLGACAGKTGVEVETLFIDESIRPINFAQSQSMFRWLTQHNWNEAAKKGSIITELTNHRGDKVLYELGECNIELSIAPASETKIVQHVREGLKELYQAGLPFSAHPLWCGKIDSDDRVRLVVPDERDSIWVKIDGMRELNKLCTIAATHITVDVPADRVVEYLNRLGAKTPELMEEFGANDRVWREYVSMSPAGYRDHRYGCTWNWGPYPAIESIEDYCRRLVEHDIVTGTGLKPHTEVEDLDITLFLRSVWWWFRLRRYGDQLCIETRPFPRSSDADIERHLRWVLGVIRD